MYWLAILGRDEDSRDESRNESLLVSTLLKIPAVYHTIHGIFHERIDYCVKRVDPDLVINSITLSLIFEKENYIGGKQKRSTVDQLYF